MPFGTAACAGGNGQLAQLVGVGGCDLPHSKMLPVRSPGNGAAHGRAEDDEERRPGRGLIGVVGEGDDERCVFDAVILELVEQRTDRFRVFER